jgi:hypothetical protein
LSKRKSKRRNLTTKIRKPKTLRIKKALMPLLDSIRVHLICKLATEISKR